MKLRSRYLWRIGDSTFVVLSFMPRMWIRGSVTVLSVITCPMSTLSRHPPAASRLFSASHWTTLRRAADCHWSDHRRRRRGRAGDRELDSCREVVRLTGEDPDNQIHCRSYQDSFTSNDKSKLFHDTTRHDLRAYKLFDPEG